jgi:hypothetical protein
MSWLDNVAVGPPGPAGPAGPAGATGQAGEPAYTFVSAPFVQPAVLGSVTIDVGSSLWMAADAYLFVATAGTYQVISIASGTQIVAMLVDAIAAPGATIAGGVVVSPSGVPGAGGGGGGGFSSGLDSARPDALLVTAGTIYYATDTGVAYQCVSSTEWVVVGIGPDKATMGPFTDLKYAQNQSGPLGGTSFTWVVNYYCETVPGSELYLWACASVGGSGRGWAIGSAVGGTTCGLLLDLGSYVKTNLVGAVNTMGPHTLAVAYDSGTIRYAFDGVVQTPIVVAGTFAPALLGDIHRIGGWVNPTLPSNWASLSWLQAFSSVLSNSDLALISGSPSDYRPQAVTGTLVFDWRANRQIPGAGAWTPVGSQSAQMAVTGPSDILKMAR